MLPQRFANPLFALLLSGFMSCIISGLSTFRALGFVDGVIGLWLMNWLTSWAVAFPIVLIIAPIVRRIVTRLTAPRP
ncbi:MAG: DUF2798 domain-containing protein [Paracoccaceae bacterium]